MQGMIKQRRVMMADALRPPRERMPLNIAIFDVDHANARLIVEAVRSVPGIDTAVAWTSSPSELESLLASVTPDLILLGVRGAILDREALTAIGTSPAPRVAVTALESPDELAAMRSSFNWIVDRLGSFKQLEERVHLILRLVSESQRVMLRRAPHISLALPSQQLPNTFELSGTR